MFQLIIIIAGALVAAIYVGFLAYSINAIPLWVIVIGTLALMIREFIVEFLRGRKSRRSADQAN